MEIIYDNMIWPSEYTDIAVVCGTSAIDLTIQICPVFYTGYNTSLLILNHIWDDVDCRGSWTHQWPLCHEIQLPHQRGKCLWE